jgi:hypothetical protein
MLFARKFKVSEAFVIPGQRLAVLGRVTLEPDSEPGATGGGYRETPMRYVLRAQAVSSDPKYFNEAQ